MLAEVLLVAAEAAEVLGVAEVARQRWRLNVVADVVADVVVVAVVAEVVVVAAAEVLMAAAAMVSAC